MAHPSCYLSSPSQFPTLLFTFFHDSLSASYSALTTNFYSCFALPVKTQLKPHHVCDSLSLGPWSHVSNH